jgi:RsiW-degrading membrane proteinase PrsW (M82 family)
LIALLGGIAGLVGALIQEIMQGEFLGPLVAGPIIEEVMKPTGVYVLLATRPRLLNNRIYTAFLAALGGLGFGLIENVLYLEVYFPSHGHELLLFRYLVNLPLHVVLSFIVGFGINQKLLAAVKGEIPLLSANKRFFIIPMLLHSGYNFLPVLISMTAA